MVDESAVWTQRDAAREYTRLARECEALFVALGAMAPGLEPPSAAIAAAQLSRRLGLDAAVWAELVPESVLLEDARAAAPPVPALEQDLGGVLATLDRLRDDLTQLLTRTTDVADGAARRHARSTLGDLDGALEPLRLAATNQRG